MAGALLPGPAMPADCRHGGHSPPSNCSLLWCREGWPLQANCRWAHGRGCAVQRGASRPRPGLHPRLRGLTGRGTSDHPCRLGAADPGRGRSPARMALPAARDPAPVARADWRRARSGRVPAVRTCGDNAVLVGRDHPARVGVRASIALLSWSGTALPRMLVAGQYGVDAVWIKRWITAPIAAAILPGRPDALRSPATRRADRRAPGTPAPSAVCTAAAESTVPPVPTAHSSSAGKLL